MARYLQRYFSDECVARTPAGGVTGALSLWYKVAAWFPIRTNGFDELDEGIQTMKKSILSIMATATLLVAASSANAQTYTYDGQTVTIDREAIIAKFCQRYPTARVCGSQVQRVPEIDASSGAQALALVFGIGLLSAEALRRRPVPR